MSSADKSAKEAWLASVRADHAQRMAAPRGRGSNASLPAMPPSNMVAQALGNSGLTAPAQNTEAAADEAAEQAWRADKFGSCHRPIDAIWNHPTSGAVVYVGTEAASQSVRLCIELNITHIVNATGAIYSYATGISHHQFCVASCCSSGASDEQVAEAFRPTMQWIDAAIACGHNVLIHCKAGMHRAGTVAVAWLMHSEDLGADAALSAIREHRPIVSPADVPGLWDLLVALDRSLVASHTASRH